MKGYYRLFGDLPDGDYEECVAFLKTALEADLLNVYEEEFKDASIVSFNDSLKRNYKFFFDCTQDSDPNLEARWARTVLVFGWSSLGSNKSHRSRQQSYIGSFPNLPGYEDYDKGHFIPHCAEGQGDHNFYPQLRELNRGWSSQGKLYRAMERYLAANEDVFFFHRPVYKGLGWIPNYIDFGIFTKQRGLILNCFDNRK